MRVERTGPIERLTPRIIRFLEGGLRGESLDKIQSPELTRIDYSCLRGLLAVEVKSLEGDPSERTNNFVDSLRDRPDFPTFYGSVAINAALKNMEGSERLERLALERVGRTIVTHLKKANEQLRRHGLDFPRQNRVNLVVLVNEDHPEYDPQTVGWIVSRELMRKNAMGLRYSSVDAVLYVTERHANVHEGTLLFPVTVIEAGSIPDLHPWKSDVLQHVMRAWASWNGVALANSEADAVIQSFEAMEHVPDEMPLHQKWRLDYARHPYLRSLSDNQLRDSFDETMVITILWGLKGSPIEVSPPERMSGMERFAHIQEEMHYRALPMEAFAFDPEREVAAAKRMGLPENVISWLHALHNDRQT